MFKKLYHWVESLAQKRSAAKWLYGISFAESSFFPIPPDVLLIPICLQNIKRSFHLAFYTTFFSVLGGMAGYLIGIFAFNLASSLIESLGYQSAYLETQKYFDQYGVLFVLVAGFSPIPYKIVAIAAGMTGFSFPLFVLASIIGRGGRFFLLATLIWFYGDAINDILKKYTNPVAYACIAIFVMYLIYHVS